MAKKEAVLAFSGGLDTSFCVPYLVDKGYDVVTLFVDTGGVDEAERRYIEERALALGAREHVTTDGGPAIWDQVVVPLVMGGQLYQGQYPLLCSDRYIIVEQALRLCRDRVERRASASLTRCLPVAQPALEFSGDDALVMHAGRLV